MIEKAIKEINYQDISELLYVKKQRESQTLDYKRDFYNQSKEFVKDITAFANKQGGQIIFGIDEKEGSIVGIHDTIGNQKIEDWISNVLNDLVTDKLDYEMCFIPISDEDTPLYILIIHVYESKNKPLYVCLDKKTLCFTRNGTSVFSAKPSEIKEMYEQKEQRNLIYQQKAKGNNITQIGINEGIINIKMEKLKNENNVSPNPEYHISGEQAIQIKTHIDKIVELNENAGKFKKKEDKGKCYRKTWNSFYDNVGVTSYLILPKEKFDEAIKWLQQQEAIQKPKLRRTNNDEWRKKNYSAIWSKLRELGLEREKAYEIANERLILKQPISSLKDLGEQNLEKLYQIIMKMK